MKSDNIIDALAAFAVCSLALYATTGITWWVKLNGPEDTVRVVLLVLFHVMAPMGAVIRRVTA